MFTTKVTILVDIKKTFFGKNFVFINNGKKNTKKDPLLWAKFMEESGAGELLINSINDDIEPTEPPIDSKTSAASGQGRMYYADWIRVMSVHSVIFVHCLLNAADTVDLQDRDAIEKKECVGQSIISFIIVFIPYICGQNRK